MAAPGAMLAGGPLQAATTGAFRSTAYGTTGRDAPGHATTAGTGAQIHTCDGGANRQARANADDTLVGVLFGPCLDVGGGGTAHGT